MADYTLYYWPLPFRGEFVRAALAHLQVDWREAGMSGDGLLDADPVDQLVPHMGPPVLTDHRAGLSMAQMPAILSYLGATHPGLIPEAPGAAALTDKIIGDANDILYEMTRHNGWQMWTRQAWRDYRPRLARWMDIFEETGRRHGLEAGTGYILGTEAPSLADLTTHVLWDRMTARFAPLRSMFEETAPRIASLSQRIAALPDQAELRAWSDAQFGETWCGGQIEASLRDVL